MRSTFVIATFALCAIAIPLPETNPTFRGGEQSCTHRGGMLVCPSKREIDIENYAVVSSNTDNIEARAIRNQGRSPALGRNKNSRNTYHEDINTAEDREVEVRAIRNQSRSKDLLGPVHIRVAENEDSEDDIYARENQAQEAVRGQRRSAEPINRSTKSSRAVAPSRDVELELDAVREPGKDRPTHPRSNREVEE